MEVKIEFAQAVLEYEGSDLFKRDPAHCINISKTLASIGNTVNNDLATKLGKEYYSLEKLNS